MTASGAPRDAIVEHLDDYLEVAKGTDYGPNGLQVEGREEIRRIVTGVSACLELFEEAERRGADAVLVHHGIFWDGRPSPLVGVQYRRVAALVRAEINLLAYHLPLDRHPEIGNNALAAKAFGLVDCVPFGEAGGESIGFRGRFGRPIPAAELATRTEKIFGQEPQAFLAGPDPIESLALVSGGAQQLLYDAIDEGCDAFLTGEVSEWVMNVARESEIHYLAAGHYATERLGIRALGEHLAEQFDVDVEFVDIPNPV